MNDANLYSKNNNLQLKDAEEFLDYYFDLINWKNDDNIMDVGSGDGSVLCKVLIPRIPKSFGSILGVDKSQDMIYYSEKLYSNSKIKFQQMDIEEAPKIYHLNRYNHIFSFNCLHWTRDKKSALKNIYSMLTDDGDLTFSIISKSPVYDLWKMMSRMPKWSKYCFDVDDHISDLHYMENRETVMKNWLYSTGFKAVKLCSIKKSFKQHTIKEFIDFSMSINPFYSRIPKKLKGDFKNDYVELTKTLPYYEESEDNGELIINNYYSSFYVYASKFKI